MLRKAPESGGASGSIRSSDGPPQADFALWCYGLTDAGQAALGRLLAARREGLKELLSDYSAEQHAELADLLSRLAQRLLLTDNGFVKQGEEKTVV